jgi:pimeloyl-ACP methyl ester carboxylesterase
MNKNLLAFFLTALVITGCKRKADNVQLLFYKDDHGKENPVFSMRDWAKKRFQILGSMQAAMGMLPAKSGLPALDVHIEDSLQTTAYTRYTINFLVAENEHLPAYLYIPHHKETHQKFPAMLALHETDFIGKGSVDGQGHNPNLAYAKELAERGYVVIAPDYPGFGDLKEYDLKNNRYQSGTMKSIFDNMRCVDLLQSRADVDANRIGIIGHSLGGHTAMFTGAFDTRLKVIVSSCGWTLFDYYNIGQEAEKIYGGRLGPWAQQRYMPLLKDKYQLDPENIPFDFDEVIAAIAPRSFFSSSPLNDGNFDVNGVKKGMANAVPVYRFLKAENNLKFSFPGCKHDFPTAVRLQAYDFIDKAFSDSK